MHCLRLKVDNKDIIPSQMKTLAIDLIEEYTYLEHMNNPFEGQELNTAHTFALTTTTHNGGRIFLFGFPRKGNKFWNIISAFPPLLWALFLASAIVYAGMFVTFTVDPSTRECPPMKDC